MTMKTQEPDPHLRLPAAERLGLCEWFHYHDHERVQWAARTMSRLGVKRVRTAISWADFHRPDGPEWQRFVFDTLAEFEVLACVWCTPPSRSRNGQINGPPQRLRDFADFVGQCLDLYSDGIAEMELWNEPNGRYYWDFVHHDPDWAMFVEMIRPAAAEVRRAGVPCVLGGIAPADPAFIRLLRDGGALEHMDVIGVHGFPTMWGGEVRDSAGGTEVLPAWDERARWQGWAHRIAQIQDAAEGRPVWVTETGLSTWAPPRPSKDEDAYESKYANEEALQDQTRALLDAFAAPTERVYWYGLQDLSPERQSIEGFHTDELAYHFGLYNSREQAKPAAGVVRKLLRDEESEVS